MLVAGVIQLLTDASLVAISLTLTTKDRNGNVIADPTHTREGDQSCRRATCFASAAVGLLGTIPENTDRILRHH